MTSIKKTSFHGVKTCVFGVQGSGKTFFVRNRIGKVFKKPLIFAINHNDGWQKLKRAYVWLVEDRQEINEDYDVYIAREFNTFIYWARQWAMQKKIDAIIIDEADMFFTINAHIRGDFKDLILNHRHIGNGVALWFMTRRPQDIPTKVVEQSQHLYIFKLEGKNAVQRFNDINPLLPPMITNLDIDKHNYIYKEIGKKPERRNPINGT